MVVGGLDAEQTVNLMQPRRDCDVPPQSHPIKPHGMSMHFHLFPNTKLKILEFCGRLPKEPLETEPQTDETAARFKAAMERFWLEVDEEIVALTDDNIHEALGFFGISIDETGRELRAPGPAL